MNERIIPLPIFVTSNHLSTAKLMIGHADYQYRASGSSNARVYWHKPLRFHCLQNLRLQSIGLVFYLRLVVCHLRLESCFEHGYFEQKYFEQGHFEYNRFEHSHLANH